MTHEEITEQDVKLSNLAHAFVDKVMLPTLKKLEYSGQDQAEMVLGIIIDRLCGDIDDNRKGIFGKDICPDKPEHACTCKECDGEEIVLPSIE